MDSFSAKLLLEMGMSSLPIIKGLKADSPDSAIADAKEAGFIVGAVVTRTHHHELGKVIGYNDTAGGFYPGSRFPIVVEFPNGTFEYNVRDLELLTIK